MAVRIRKKGGNWYVFVNYAGRMKAKCIGTNKAAAEQVKRIIEAKLALGDLGFLQDAQAAEEKRTTFQQYANGWIEKYAAIHCKPSTVASHRQLLRLYLLPRFGLLPLEQITRESVRDFLSELASRRKAERKKSAKRTGSSAVPADQTTSAKLPHPSAAKLSRNTLRLVLCTLRVILNHAIDDGVIDQNPAARLGKLTKTEKPKAQAQAQALTRPEVDVFLNPAKEICPDYYPLFLTAVRAGLRRGELGRAPVGGHSVQHPAFYPAIMIHCTHASCG